MKRYSFPISIAVLVVFLCVGTFIGTNVTKNTFSDDNSAQMTNGALDSVVPGATVITLTENGFTPDQVTLKMGDTITFRSTLGSLYWPASNLHPSHLLYSEFDPLEPIQPNQSWSFTFTKVGVWKFHDHLFPYYTGVITVTE